MSLINGMDDIITHMKNQELRIKALEEKNRKLTEQMAELKDFKKEADDTCGASVVMDSMMSQIAHRDRQIENYERIKEKEKYSNDLIDCLIMKIIQMSPDSRIMENGEHVCMTYPFLCNKDLLAQEKERENFDEYMNELFHDLNMRDWSCSTLTPLADDEMKIVYEKIDQEDLTKDYGFKFSIEFSDTTSEDS